jgi:holliday junction DNA helicase RuvA
VEGLPKRSVNRSYQRLSAKAPFSLSPYAACMIRSIAGRLVEIDVPLLRGGTATGSGTALIEPEGSSTGYELLLPGFLAIRMEQQVGQIVRLRTLHYLESHGQGTSFIPRLIGFSNDAERRFFEVFTTVKGLGYRRALRALAEEPPLIAEMIVTKDARALTRLPEVGKRLAETIIAELTGKVDAFLDLGATDGLGSFEPKPVRTTSKLPPIASDAVEALVALGESRSEAERRVETVLARQNGEPLTTVEAVLQRALGG